MVSQITEKQSTALHINNGDERGAFELTELFLSRSDLTDVSLESPNALKDCVIQAVVLRNKGLTRLSIKGTPGHSIYGGAAVTDTAIVSIWERRQQLQALEIRLPTTGFDQQFFETLVQSVRGLKELAIVTEVVFKNSMVDLIAKYSPDLTSLALRVNTEVTEEGVRKLFLKLEKLELATS